MRRLSICLAIAAALLFGAASAWAQSSPGLVNGQIPTAAQWNGYFAGKQDYNPNAGGCAWAPCQAAVSTAPNALLATGAGGNLSFVTTLPSGLVIPSPSITGTTAFTSLTLSTPLAVGYGGTGAGALTANALIIGNGTSAVQFLPEVNGDCAVGAGGVWTTGSCGSGGGGTVSSVGFSVPASSIFSVTGQPVTTSGTIALATAGTSGGIPYFSSSSQLSSSAALTANLPVIGGGAGVCANRRRALRHYHDIRNYLRHPDFDALRRNRLQRQSD